MVSFEGRETMTHLGRSMSEEFEPGLVSVIVPTYNRAGLLGESMGSVFAQTYRPIELIVIDDGSTDNTEELVSALGEKYAQDAAFTLRYLRQENQGAPAARNSGLIESRGEHIQFLDSDDLLAQHKIAAQIRALSLASGADVAYASWRCVYGERRVKYGPRRQAASAASEEQILRDYFSGRSFLPSDGVLFRRSAVARIGPWDERLLQRQDTDYLTRALLMGFRFIHVPEAEVYYRRHQSDHIGHPARSARNFDSLLLLFRKWRTVLAGMGELDKYRRELLVGLAQISEHAAVMGIPDGLERCEELACELFGSSVALRESLTLYRRLVVVAKRFLGRPLRSLLGEYYVMLAKEAVVYVTAGLRTIAGSVREKKRERSSPPCTPHDPRF